MGRVERDAGGKVVQGISVGCEIVAGEAKVATAGVPIDTSIASDVADAVRVRNPQAPIVVGSDADGVHLGGGSFGAIARIAALAVAGDGGDGADSRIHAADPVVQRVRDVEVAGGIDSERSGGGEDGPSGGLSIAAGAQTASRAWRGPPPAGA